MARKRSKKNQKMNEDDFVQIDVYYLPKEQAEMYRVLREVVKEEVIEWAQNQFDTVKLESDAEEGEGINAYDAAGELVFVFYLNPTNISQAQKARDKEQLPTYLETLIK